MAGPRVRVGVPRREARSQYYAFLSYSHKDEELAEWLHGELEEFHVPAALSGRLTANGVIPRKLAPIFRDKQELAAASDLGEEIRAALAASQFLVVLCSPAAASSRWTNAEIEAFKRSRPDGCVLAVIASGEPFASDDPGREAEECFPPALRERYDKRGRATGKRAEPIAADLRGDADDRRLGFLRLVAGMLGVGLDDLVRRETTRRQRRLAWVTGGSLAGMVIASGLAITAIQARDAARDQRREAEGLVAFMLGDLKDKLEPIGKLDALDGVGAKVLEYYGKQNMSQLSDAGLLQRSSALSLTAQVAYLRGDLHAAEKLYLEAMSGTAEAIRRRPDDPQRIYEHVQNVFYFGMIAADRGRLDQAERSFREYRRLADKMVLIAPNNLKWRMEVQYAEANLGFVLLRQRRFHEAAAQFTGALKTIEAVAAVDSSNPDYQKSVAESLAWLADAELARGDLNAASNARRRQVDLLKSMMARSGDVKLRQKVIPAQQALGRILAAQGRDGEASSQLADAVANAERLLPTEPDNSKWLDFAATAHFALAQFQMNRSQLAAADANNRRGCALASTLSKLSGAAADWNLNSWSCVKRGGELALARGDGRRALVLAERSVAIARQIRSGDSVGDSYLLAKGMLLVGDAYQALGDHAKAQSTWQSAIALTGARDEQPWESAVKAQLLFRLGRAAEAREIGAQLERAGVSNDQMLKS
ncbi:MAG: toll/interleukin-1 receptor domain-containing protein [Sphingomicrobium sp.]